MTVFYADKATDVFDTSPPVKVSPAAHGGRVRVLSDTVTLASQTTSDTIVLFGGKLPIGAQVLYGVITTTTSLGSSTIAIGITGSTSKYKAAATFTSTNTPTLFGAAAALLTPVTTEEQLFITIGAATLPASGTLHVELFYALD
jgi:hypothetical protein